MTPLDSILQQLEETTKAVIALARQLAAARADADEWTRLPAPKNRCPVSRWSRSKINSLIAAGKVRAKSVQGAKFYAAADVRKLLNQ